MKILSIREGAYEVGAVVHERASGRAQCALLDQLNGLEAAYAASGRRLLAYFGQMAEKGPGSFSSDQVHIVDAPNKIYEFVAGRLRVLFFYSSTGKMVVCSHLFVKKTQKVPPTEVASAVAQKKKFDAALIKKSINWVKEL